MCDKTGVNINRFRKLIDNSGVARQVIAEQIGCDVSTITKHYNNDRKITVDYVIKYAKYFNVSADYLLGLSDVPTTDKDLQFVCDYTGLSEKSVKELNSGVWFKNYFANSESEEYLSAVPIINEKANIQDEFISQDCLDKVSEYSAAYVLNKRRTLSIYLEIIDSLTKKGVVEKSAKQRLDESKDKTDLNLFRMQQIVLEFAKSISAKENEALKEAEEGIDALEELINKQVESGYFDLDEIKKAGEKYADNTPT